MDSPGPLLAQGRDADIFEYGPNLVLRRSRRQRSMANEAKTMAYAQSMGYPVPTVDEVSEDGMEMSMERIAGSVMIDEMGKRPWALKRYGAMLAELQLRLHELEAPTWLNPSPGAVGDRLLHFDLHPLNIMMSRKGPIVIDWANAVRGQSATDVALTWTLIATGGFPKSSLLTPVIGHFRKRFVNGYLDHIDQLAAQAELSDVVAFKVKDPNMTDQEQQRMWDLARRNRPSPGHVS
jgi:tRNA A-37 threonylcarbamoyl transferase component Bud32